MIKITNKMLDSLRLSLSVKMSEKRYRHTLEVEEMVVRLAALYCPEDTMVLRAAALLHDTTKELTTAEQLRLCEEHGLTVTPIQLFSPKTFHARTAVALLPALYPAFGVPEVMDPVRWHTTGREGMTVQESLLYLADYIDLSRTFPNCVILRDHFWDNDPASMDSEERMSHLWRTLVLSFDMTIQDLLEEGAPIADETVQARNDLLKRLSGL